MHLEPLAFPALIGVQIAESRGNSSYQLNAAQGVGTRRLTFINTASDREHPSLAAGPQRILTRDFSDPEVSLVGRSEE